MTIKDYDDFYEEVIVKYIKDRKYFRHKDSILMSF